MDNLAQNYQHVPTDTNGLYDLFQKCPDLSPDRTVSTPAMPGLCPDLPPAQWWTLSEASSHLNVNERTLRRWIKQGKIEAAKVKGAFGDEWRIMPGPVRSGVDINPGQCPDLSPDRTMSTPAMPGPMPGPDPEVIELRTKLELAEQEKADLKKQLQGATYRNGYLEAQLEAERQTIKLLTDSQHKPGWWTKLAHWFRGGQ